MDWNLKNLNNMQRLGLAVLLYLLVINFTSIKDKLCNLWDCIFAKTEGLSGYAEVEAHNPEDTTNEVPAEVTALEEPKKVTFADEKNKTLKAEDLLPKSSDMTASLWAKVNPVGEKKLKDKNFLVGVDTQGSSLRNANLQLRADPPNPRKKVSPWMNSTIEQDPLRKKLC